jgi:hypothetical protein
LSGTEFPVSHISAEDNASARFGKGCGEKNRDGNNGMRTAKGAGEQDAGSAYNTPVSGRQA